MLDDAHQECFAPERYPCESAMFVGRVRMHVNVWPSGRYSAMCECRSGQSQTFPGQAELLTSAKQSPRPEVSWGFPGTREQLPMHVLEMLGAAEVSREVKKPAVKLQLNLGRLSWLHSRQSRAPVARSTCVVSLACTRTLLVTGRCSPAHHCTVLKSGMRIGSSAI